ncbi:sulfotransferase family protein [Streptomyces caniscabiei]|uniref:Sulfotransferase n=1 Tax=Streptomyces caniscabiei TaxID=2746961 RepID=A0A927LI62_9ACTN|nr:sulfotransferase [Streptomyces caniscabiei]MBD9729473.1 sulfotransferase [Streptomyces caniscabiei]MDX3515223.1 sulfotransferase [Streptomyces caniscabiei]MDX3724418.1 sulfotransferase [Streptomyces caniscabiei]WEO28912.1 sulfotransferase [Streptomyces caniscabiei]
MRSTAPVFIVSTGRCGSTLLSEMLGDHPDVLSVSELLALLAADPRFSGEENGIEFWRRLMAPAPTIDAVVRDGIEVPELIYPYGSGRFDSSDGVPGLCHMTLPMLSQTPDLLYDELADELPHWPRRPVPEQYLSLFAWLAARFRRPLVVERTGGSLEFVPDLRAAFPGARFVYLGRDGADTALSMSRHALCRLRVLADDALRILGVSSPDQVGPQDPALLRQALEPLTPPFGDGRLMSRDISLTTFGQLWSQVTRAGLAALSELPAADWTAVRYENLLHHPERELTALAKFLGIPAPTAWISAAAARADPSRVGASHSLSAEEYASLRTACTPGTAADEAAHARASSAGTGPGMAPALARTTG